MQRVDPSNWQWIVSCCGGIPISGLIQSLIITVPITAYNTIYTLLVNMIFLPKAVYHIYRCIIFTRTYGINIKIFLSIFGLIPIFAYLPTFAALVMSASFLFGIGGPTYFILDNDRNFFYGGILQVIQISQQYVGQLSGQQDAFITAMQEKFFNYPPPKPTDIPFFTLIFYIVLGLYGMMIQTILGSIYFIFGFFPCVYKLMKTTTERFANCSKLLCFFPYFICMLLCPVAASVVLTILLVVCLLTGCINVKIAIESDLICNGFRAPFIEFTQKEIYINNSIYNINQSYLGRLFCGCQYARIPSDIEQAQSYFQKDSNSKQSTIDTDTPTGDMNEDL